MNNYNELIKTLKEAILNEVYDKDKTLITELTREQLSKVGGQVIPPLSEEPETFENVSMILQEIFDNNKFKENQYNEYRTDLDLKYYNQVLGKVSLIIGQSDDSNKNSKVKNDFSFGLYHALKDHHFNFSQLSEILTLYKESFNNKYIKPLKSIDVTTEFDRHSVISFSGKGEFDKDMAFITKVDNVGNSNLIFLKTFFTLKNHPTVEIGQPKRYWLMNVFGDLIGRDKNFQYAAASYPLLKNKLWSQVKSKFIFNEQYQLTSLTDPAFKDLIYNFKRIYHI